MKIKDWIAKHEKYFPVGEGWRPLVEQLVKDIAKINPEIEVHQVKEKFGGLRFCCDNRGDENIDALIAKAESESYEICALCGTRENVTTEGDWILTLCTTCRKKK